MGYLGNNLVAANSAYRLIDSLTSSFNGTTTSFALTVNSVTPVPFPLNEQNVLISVGGVPQKPDPTGTEGFRFSGSNIVFSSAPKTGEAFWGVILAGADYIAAGVSYPDGAASAPSITFGSQNTTGLYRPGSGQLGVALNGVNTATFSSSGLTLNGSTSGYTILSAPAAAGSNTLTLPTNGGSANQTLLTDGAGNLSFGSSVVSGTSQATTSGTSIDFTGIPSWVKRITMMLSGVSLNGSSVLVIRLGTSSGFATTGYNTMIGTIATANNTTRSFSTTTHFPIQYGGDPSYTAAGNIVFTNLTGNTWTGTGIFVNPVAGNFDSVSGGISLGAALTQVRLTTFNGTDAFDAGSVNILYE